MKSPVLHLFLVLCALAAQDRASAEDGPGNGSEDPAGIWDRLGPALASGSEAARTAATEEILGLPDRPGLALLVARAAAAARMDAKISVLLARKLSMLKGEAESARMAVDLLSAEAGLGRNARPELASLYLAFLLKAREKSALGIAEGILPKLSDPAPVLAVLMDEGGKEGIGIVGRYALARRNIPAALRRAAVRDFLGSWRPSPPCFEARIPILIKALEARETSEEACAALEKLTLRNRNGAAAWKAWWEPVKDMGDSALIFAAMRDAFASAGRADGAAAIERYASEWGMPAFSWAAEPLAKALLAFENDDLRCSILHLLGRIRNPSCLKPVWRLYDLRKNAGPELISCIARCMGLVAGEGDENTGWILTVMYDASLASRVHEEVIRAWGSIGYEPATDRLIALVEADGGERKAWLAAEALGSMKCRRALPRMAAAFRRTKDVYLQRSILGAMAEIGVLAHEVSETGSAALESGDEGVLEAAIGLQKALADPAALPGLKGLFSRADSAQKTILRILDALESYPPAQVGDVFAEALGSRPAGQIAGPRSTSKVNEAAAAYFEKDGFRNLVVEARKPLAALLRVRSSACRTKAVKYMGHDRLWGEDAMKALAGLFEPDEDEAVVLAAVEVLATRPSRELVDLLIDRLSGGRNRFEWVDLELVYLLGRMVDASRLPAADRSRSERLGTDKARWKDWWSGARERF